MYDWAHGQCDSIEGITHSICTLEYADHRPLYDWFLEQLGIYHPQQIEFARLATTYTVVSKRKLLKLVQQGLVSGWDDPRMPTLSALRRRGYTPAAIRNFCERVGVARTRSPGRSDNVVEIELLESCLRDDLNLHLQRVMAVLHPLKVVLTNYPDDLVEHMDAINNPEDESMGKRQVAFSRVLYIEREDFMENPPKNYYRLAPGREVRLRYAYFIRCQEAIKDAQGNIVELRCTYDPATHGGDAPDGRKVKSTLHWVSAAHALDAEVRLYDRLFAKPFPEDAEEGEEFMVNLNPNSLKVLHGCKIEPFVKGAPAGSRYQFERQGYFCIDPDSTPDKLVFNRTVALRDTWAKVQQRGD
jgi:glutaminyl-tRNA synthetase